MADVLTYKNMQDRVLRQLDEAGDTDTTLALVKDGLNEANKKRATQERWPFMIWDDPVLLNIVASQQAYTLHPEFYRPFYFWNRLLQDYLVQIDEATLGPSLIDVNNDHDDARRFTLFGRSPVAAQPPAGGSVLTVTSSNAADNNTKQVSVRGDTADGVTTETLTCSVAGSTTFTRILKVTKIGTWAGTMTLSAGATTLLKLFVAEAGRSYQNFRLLYIPDQAQVVEYKFYRQPIAMSLDEDRPDIPTPYEELLVWDTLLKFAAYNEYSGTVVELWKENQKELWLGMQQAYSDDRAIEMGPAYTTYVPR